MSNRVDHKTLPILADGFGASYLAATILVSNCFLALSFTLFTETLNAREQKSNLYISVCVKHRDTETP